MRQEQIAYSEMFGANEQVNMEERIAAMIFDHPDNEMNEETCGELGRQILYAVLRRFCRHYFMDWPQAKERKPDVPDEEEDGGEIM